MNAIWWWLGQNSILVAILIPIALVACRLVRNRPAVQHAIWLMILLKIVTPPLIAWPWSVEGLILRSVSNPQRVTAPEASVTPLSQGVSVVPEADSPAPVLNVSQDEIVEPGENAIVEQDVVNEKDGVLTSVMTGTNPVAPPVVGRLMWIRETQPWIDWSSTLAANGIPASLQAVLVTFAPLALITWLVMACGAGLWQLRRMVRLSSVVCNSRPVPQHLVDEVEKVAVQLKIRPPQVVVVDGISSPFIWCAWRTRLIWPVVMTSEAQVAGARGVIAHELAHLRRRDHWFAWLELAGSVVWWWNPLFWFVQHRLRETAEMASDALAIATAPDRRREYADLLLALSASFNPGLPTPVLGIGSRNVKTFKKRLTMILSDRVSAKLPWSFLMVVAGLFLMILPHLSIADSSNTTEQSEKTQIADGGDCGDVIRVPEGATLDVPDDRLPEDQWGTVNIPVSVVDRDKKPIAGAKIFLQDHRISETNLVGTTDRAGKLTFQTKRRLGAKRAPGASDKVTRTYVYPSGAKSTLTTRTSRHTDEEEIDGMKSYVVAVAPGFGFGISRPGVGLNIQLAADVPVTGRVVDFTGAPVQGAQVRVRNVKWPRRADDPRGQQRPIPPGDGLDPWLAEVRRATTTERYRQPYEFRGSYEFLTTLEDYRGFAPLIASASSDQNGRFTLHGIGAERVAEIYIDGVADKASSLIVVATRSLEKPITVAHLPNFGSNSWSAFTNLSIYGVNFETTLSPGRNIEGVVSDLITGSPIAGVKVIGPELTVLDHAGYDRFFATTDEKGYFRIDGLPVGREGTFSIEPHEALRYLGREMDLKIQSGAGPQRVDIGLSKGVWISGKVVDDTTGQGLSKSIRYHTFNDNPHLKKDRDAGVSPLFNSDSLDADGSGRFRIRGYPGRGIVTAGSAHDYLRGFGADKIPGLKRNEFRNTLYSSGRFNPYDHNSTIEVNIPEGVETFECEVRLYKGKWDRAKNQSQL